jgi:hypothetical protein
VPGRNAEARLVRPTHSHGVDRSLDIVYAAHQLNVDGYEVCDDDGACAQAILTITLVTTLF